MNRPLEVETKAKRAMRSLLLRGDGGSHQSADSRRDKGWSGSGYTLKLDPAGFHGDLDMGVRGREGSVLMLGFLA